MAKKRIPRRKKSRLKLTPEQAAIAHKEMTALLATELPNQGMNRGLKIWRKRRAESERFAEKQYAQYLAAGGEQGTGKPFGEWVKSVNWAKVLEFVLKIVALFGAMA